MNVCINKTCRSHSREQVPNIPEHSFCCKRNAGLNIHCVVDLKNQKFVDKTYQKKKVGIVNNRLLVLLMRFKKIRVCNHLKSRKHQS